MFSGPTYPARSEKPGRNALRDLNIAGLLSAFRAGTLAYYNINRSSVPPRERAGSLAPQRVPEGGRGTALSSNAGAYEYYSGGGLGFSLFSRR